MAKLSNNDLAVQATNEDATSCKRYAVDRGYWNDEFVKYFYRSSEKKSPEISRGYFARVHSIHILINQFLQLTQRKCQLVVFGAGYDTLYWLLWKQGNLPLLFTEVDFPDVTSRKCHYIKVKKALSDALTNAIIGKDSVQSDRYRLVPADLREVESLGRQLFAAGLDPHIPTLFLAECVLVYLDELVTKQLIKWTAKHFKTSIFINYDPINPSDRFGQTMQQNLKARGCSLLGLESCPDTASQEKRYYDNGWEGVWSLDMAQVYSFLPREDVHRIERIDFLDEQELLIQLLQHYCLSCAYRDGMHLGLDTIKLS